MLSSEEVKSEQIEDILAKFSEMGINVVETKEAEPEEEVATREEPEEETEGDNELVEVQQRPVPAKSGVKEPADRTDDPVRIYLREMGSKELLSREGEIAIAKRIEAGREAMIAGLCESPLTFQAIIIWRDELNEGKVLLRDIIDVDATYAGPGAKADAGTGDQPRRPVKRRHRRPRPTRECAADAGAGDSARDRHRRSSRPAYTPTARTRQPTGDQRQQPRRLTTIWRIGSRSPQSRRSSSQR